MTMPRIRLSALSFAFFFLLALSFPPFGRAATEDQVTLVENGIPKATIVLASDPTRAAQFAAKELQYHIRKITGVDLPIANEDEPLGDSLRIFVGESKGTIAEGLTNRSFEKQEYLVDVKPDRIMLMGRDQEDKDGQDGKKAFDYDDYTTFPSLYDAQGTCYAVYDFLEKFCDVRWYLPTDLGIVHPKTSTLRVGTGSVRRAPAVKTRRQTIAYQIPKDLIGSTLKGDKPTPALPWRDQMLWYHRSRLGGKPVALGHSLYGYYDRFWRKDPKRKDVFEGAHPEWFVEGYVNKTRSRPPQLRYGNPDLVAQVVKDAVAYFDEGEKKTGAAAEGDSFSVVPMDSKFWGDKGEAPPALIKSTAERGKGHFSNDRVSDYVFNFVAKVARAVEKTHPDKKISTIAYWEYAYPPEQIKLPSNVMVWMCLHTRTIHAKDVQENDRAIFESWEKSAPGLSRGLWMYYCFPALHARQREFRCFPGFFAHSLVKQLNYYISHGVEGISYEPSYLAYDRRSVLLDQLEFYVTWRLADDPSLDGDALIDEFFTRYYGAAAAPMKAFYEMVEHIYADPKNYAKGHSQTEEIAWGSLGTEERMDKLAHFMEQARKADTTAIEKRRVALFDKGIWQYMLAGRKAYTEKLERKAITGEVTAIPQVSAGDDWRKINWEAGAALDHWFTLNDGKSDRHLEGRVLHDEDFLYLRLDDQLAGSELVTRSNEVWDEDYWEILIGKDRSKPLLRFGVNAKGRLRAQNTQTDLEDIKVAVDEDVAHWRTYLAIPLELLAFQNSTETNTLFLNVLRATAGRDAAVWTPAPKTSPSALVLGKVQLD